MDPNDPRCQAGPGAPCGEKKDWKRNGSYAPLPDTAAGLSTGLCRADKIFAGIDGYRESEISRNSDCKPGAGFMKSAARLVCPRVV